MASLASVMNAPAAVRGAVRPSSVVRRSCRASRTARFTVRATEDREAVGQSSSPPPAAAPEASPSKSTAPPPPKGVALDAAMAFSGPAPEVINGRLAMLGFAAALGAELASGETVGAQFSSIPGPMIFVVALFTTASLVPLAKQGEKKESFGPFTPGAEMLNGRAAMLGFASLLIYEAVKGSPLF